MDVVETIEADGSSSIWFLIYSPPVKSEKGINDALIKSYLNSYF